MSPFLLISIIALFVFFVLVYGIGWCDGRASICRTKKESKDV